MVGTSPTGHLRGLTPFPTRRSERRSGPSAIIGAVPTYDYQCRACGLVTEVIHSMLEPGPSACTACGGELRRVLFPTGIIFKGSGFYRNDSRAAASDAGKAPASAAGGDSGSSATSASEPKKAAGAGDGASTTASDAKSSSSEGT